MLLNAIAWYLCLTGNMNYKQCLHLPPSLHPLRRTYIDDVFFGLFRILRELVEAVLSELINPRSENTKIRAETYRLGLKLRCIFRWR